MICVISPHLDDAVLSLGQMIEASDDVEIVTVFAGIPAEDALSDYDRSCGYESSVTAMADRQAEDVLACEALGVRHRHLSFLDRQYQPERTPQDATRLTRALRPLWDGTTTVFAPVGIGHPDHDFVARCALSACPDGMFVYEELPSRVLWPEQVVARLGEIRAAGFMIASLPHYIDVGERAAKELAIGCYESQFPDGAADPCLLVPERAWRIAR